MHKSRHTGSQEPELDKCRTGKVGSVIPGTTREMYYCKIDNEDCKFVMPFGFDYICQHLNNHTFIVPLDEDHGKVIAVVLADSTDRFMSR